MANHLDNLDLFDSKYQPWNSVAIGPQKDIIGLFAKAAKKNGLCFAVSVHVSQAWTRYEPAQISVLPHELRHAYVTHCLNCGANPRAIQEAMGHKSLETTMAYLHVQTAIVPSPLDG